MSFVGIIADNKNFKSIRNGVLEKIENYDKKLELIEITPTSIENIKNIKFETIVITTKLDKFKNYFKIIENILSNATYLIINSDIDMKNGMSENLKFNIVTYGLNRKATITISSISDDNIIICLQRNIRDIKNKVIEPKEFNIKLRENDNKIIYNILAKFSILLVYNQI